tara:strand:+ start:18235 stop:18639 length:405 start_codon:yes stop_codon:yes gene_type:complete
MTYFSEHFTEEELACPTTGNLILQEGFIEDLEELRVAYAKPMVINSGCRSYAHNEKLLQDGLPAAKSSLHLIGNRKYATNTLAVDLAKPNIFDQARFIEIALRLAWTVRVANTFIHVDQRTKYTGLKQHFDTYG